MVLFGVRKPKRLPVVLARPEVGAVLSRLNPPVLLVCQLLYGSGLRLNEALALRVKELDLQRCKIRLKQAKGKKDRVTMVPGAVCVTSSGVYAVRKRATRLC